MITVNLYYKGTNGSAKAFAEEMESSGIADAIRAEEGNLRYQYFQPLNDPETVLLIDSWKDQAAIDAHHATSMMQQIVALREKYDLHMTMERFVSDEYDSDEAELIKNVGGRKYLVEGNMKLADINDALGTDLSSEDYDSIGGLMIENLDRLPSYGETVTLDSGITLTARGIKRNRITKVLMTVNCELSKEQKETL